MSWCRWSTEVGNKQSDLYIYESVADNIAVHVAGRRRANYGDNPHILPKIDDYRDKYDNWIDLYVEEYSKVSPQYSEWMAENTIWEVLPEKWAGKDFYYEYNQMDELKNLLDEMMNDGLTFPEYVYDYIDELIKEKQNEKKI